MWLMILILFAILLATQSIVNMLKIWDYIEMLKTSKHTADILEKNICDCLGKEEEK